MDAPDVTYALVASPTFAIDGICFAALESGLYRTDDRGVSWRSIYGRLGRPTASQITAVALSPAYTQDGNVFAGPRGGILRSDDGGASWTAAALASPPPVVTAIVYSPSFTEDQTALAATLEDGVFRSIDGGRTWASANMGLLDYHVLTLAAISTADGSSLTLAGTDSGASWSSTGGRSWREIDVLAGYGPVLSLAFAGDFGVSGTIFVGTESGLLRASVSSRSSHSTGWMADELSSVAGPVNAVVSCGAAGRRSVLAVGETTMQLSLDDGETWSQLAPVLPAGSAFTSVVAPMGLQPNAPLIVGTNGHAPLPLVTTVVGY